MSCDIVNKLKNQFVYSRTPVIHHLRNWGHGRNEKKEKKTVGLPKIKPIYLLYLFTK